MNRFVTRCLTVASVALATLALADSSSAVVRRYSASGGAQFTSPNDFVGEGTATHLGRYSEIGNVTFTPTSNPTVLAVDGWVAYTASDGDVLRATVAGELDALTGAVTATVTYVSGGSGRFADAGGSSTLVGQVNGGSISVSVSGNIDF